MSQKYDKYLENHRQAVKKAYQWIAAYIPELTDVEATRNIEFHDMSKNTPDEYKPYDDYFYGEQTPAVIEAFNRAWLKHCSRSRSVRRTERALQDHDFVSYSISKVKGP